MRYIRSNKEWDEVCRPIIPELRSSGHLEMGTNEDSHRSYGVRVFTLLNPTRQPELLSVGPVVLGAYKARDLHVRHVNK